MKVIYDELYPEEFFRYGGQVLVGSFNFKVDTYGHWKETIHAPKWTYDYVNKNGGDAWIGDMHFSYDEENNWFKYKGSFPHVDKNDPYGIDNVNFSLIDDQDVRWNKYADQRKERGFDDSELWNLDCSIAKFILPRLERYQEIKCAHPAMFTEAQWTEIIGKMISAFKTYLYNSDLTQSEDIIKKFIKQGIIKMPEWSALETHNDYIKGMEYFNKYWQWLGD